MNSQQTEKEIAAGVEYKFREAAEKLDNIPQFMGQSGIMRAQKMLTALGHPERRFKIIHVAGTNGKGSVCAYLEQILRENGYRTGLFVSPHLTDIRERICIDGAMIGKEQFVQQYERVRCADDAIRTTGTGLAYFDYFLGIGLCAFAEAEIDFMIMETGLGGRLDATNAVEAPVLCVITSISLEHTAVLGDTVAKIASEKAGIIKKNVPVVYLSENAEAGAVIKKAAQDAGAPAVPVSRNMYEIHKNTGKRIDFWLHNGYYKNDCFSIATGAVYQAQNCALALTAAAVLHQGGAARLEPAAVSAAVYKTYWPGRMEEITAHVYVDGAHNPEGIECLIETAAAVSNGRKCSLLFSVVNDKNYEEMIRRICGCGMFDRYVVTQIEGKRQLADTCIQDIFKRYTKCPVDTFDSVREAYFYALEKRQQEQLLFCTGSLYLIGELKAITAGTEAE